MQNVSNWPIAVILLEHRLNRMTTEYFAWN
jgi:hypothetical protein